MTSPSPQPNPSETSSLRSSYVIPFGRVLGQNDGDPPVNEVLVGREDERAYFVNLLVSRGPTGSYLITGRRGVGKSSFVRHCLTEYGGAVFKRFLRGNSGKSFWDFSVIVLFSFLTICSSLALSEFAALLFMTSVEDSKGKILQIIAIFLFLICIFPLVYARQIFEIVVRTRKPIDPVESSYQGMFLRYTYNIFKKYIFKRGTFKSADVCREILERAKQSASRFASSNASLLTIIAVFFYFTMTDIDPPILLSRVFVALCGLYAFVNFSSFQGPSQSDLASESRRQRLEFIVWVLFILLAILVIQIDLLELARQALEFVFPLASANAGPENMAWLTLATGFILLSGGNFARWMHIHRRWKRRLVMFGWRDGGLWYVFFSFTSLLGLAVCIFMNTNTSLSDSRIILLILFGIIILFFAISVRFREEKWECLSDADSPHFRPRPRMLLTLKGICAVIVGLQLGAPSIALLVNNYDFTKTARADQGGTPLPIWMHKQCVIFSPQPTPHAGIAATIENSPISSTSELINGMISRKTEPCQTLNSRETWWIAILLLIVLLFYLIEYEWVVRPFINARDERSLDPARRPPWEDQESSDVLPHQRFQYRQMERLTFPWMTYTTLLQTLSVTVNLGFDKLDHRSVIHAMLVGLRHEYNRQFLAWHSGTANIVRISSLLVLLFLCGQLSQAWFSLPALPDIDKDKDTYEVASRIWEGNSLEEILATTRSLPTDAHQSLINLDPSHLIYKKHPDDRSDRICRYYSDMERYFLHISRNNNFTNSYHDNINKYANTTPALNFLCSLEKSDFWISFLYFDILSMNATSLGKMEKNNQVIYWFINVDAKIPFGGPENIITLRSYHIILMFWLYFIGRWIMYWFPLLPYKRNLSRIDDLLDSLSARTVQRRGSWKPAQWINLVFGDGAAAEIERAPSDSRTIELAFLEILRDLQNGSIAFLRGTMQRLSIPAPEITFVFDELDKLGITIDAEDSRTADSPEDMDVMGAERQRSLALHRLMSDMKRILSAAPARFIFVGGRQLHDEWLADQTSRQPLLTSIFNAEVYLPSLLTDHGMAEILRAPKGRPIALHDRVQEYLSLQHYLAIHNMGFWTSARWRPVAGLGLRWEQQESYFQPGGNGTISSNIKEHWDRLRAISPFEMQTPSEKREWEKDFLWSFIRFLTYRSVGNPKRLRELTLGFLQPVGRVIRDEVRWANQAMACHEVLYFNDNAIFRIQFLDSVYQHLVDRFGSRLLQRDDKIAVSLFFIADFLFKFHRRAFAWANLQRIEELVHIHRAPDLRLILEELVEHCTDHFLQPVLNGMYTFRFRSEFSREIDYLSRCSEDDLAAFNFTLDESQSLKRPYMVGLRGGHAENAEYFAGVGELFEFDEEFEMARHHYRKAIILLDNELGRLKGVGSSGEPTNGAQETDWTPLGEVLADVKNGRQLSVASMSWGMARLRLMLQIGMTYEISRNAERAETEYRAAFVLAERLFDAYLESITNSDTNNDRWPLGEKSAESSSGKDSNENMAWRFRTGHALKHMVLIYQPVFAIAWIAEKLVGDIDASASIIDEYIDRLRNRLPFVKEKSITFLPEKKRTSHSNFSLIIAELHRKAGDLYFFKGHQYTPVDKIIELSRMDRNLPNNKMAGDEGFLLRAHYHYIVTLHELRRHVQARIISSGTRLGTVALDGERPHNTMQGGQHPSYIHLATGNALSDLADSMLSRVSLIGVLDWLAGGIRATSHRTTQRVSSGTEGGSFSAVFKTWFETESPLDKICDAPPGDVIEVLEHPDDGGSPSVLRLDGLSDWIGFWNGGYCAKTSIERVTAGRTHWSHERLLMALRLSELSADYSLRGGYHEDAARKCMQACETVCTLFWWIAGLKRLAAGAPIGSGDTTMETLYDIIRRATSVIAGGTPTGIPDKRDYLLHLRHSAEKVLRQAVIALEVTHLGRDGINRTPRGYLLRGTLSPHVLTLACSLYLSTDELLGPNVNQSKLHALICQIAGEEPPANSREAIHDTLRASIVRSRYPILNRLNALHTLINSEIKGVCTGAEKAGLEARQLRLDNYVREWLELLDGFDAPLHFSPLSVGTTLIWFCLALADHGVRPPGRGERLASGSLRSRFGKHQRLAFRQLERSLQMHTMGQAYYETISNLYYLYDDFNDPHIHFHRSIQMAGSELISILSSHSIKQRLDPEAGLFSSLGLGAASRNTGFAAR